MIRIENLVKDFGARRAVDHVSFQVEKGTVLGFLGPNGAGKTTTIRIVAGYLEPTSGRVEVDGINVVERPVEAQRRIGYMPETTPLYADMTVEEFLRFIGEVRGFRGADLRRRLDQVLESCLLQSVRHQTIETLSKGYRQRTCFAQAIFHDPPVLLLDEPTEGLDPNQKQVVREMIRKMAADKVIVLCTHVLEEVEAVCSRALIISRGRVVADSTPEELKKRSRSYNTVTLQVVAPVEEAREAFRGLPDVAEVELLGASAGSVALRLVPRDQQPVAVGALDLARRRGWLVTDVRTDSGRLDEVFRQITTTEDAA